MSSIISQENRIKIIKKSFRIFPESQRRSKHGARSLHPIVLKKREVHTKNGSTEKSNMLTVLLIKQEFDSDVKSPTKSYLLL